MLRRGAAVLHARLPPDLVRLVHAHAAASAIQLRWRRLAWLGHARHRAWPEVRAGLGETWWRVLIAFPLVRREWRREPESWLSVGDPLARVIAGECEDGLWGMPLRDGRPGEAGRARAAAAAVAAATCEAPTSSDPPP